MQDKKIICYGLSLSLHMLCLLIAIILFDFPHKTYLPGESNSPFIHAYFYDKKNESIKKIDGIKKSSVSNEIKKSLHINRKEKKRVENKKSKDQKNKDPNNNENRLVNRKEVKGQTSHELLMLLHSAIQNKQRYPERARQMERRGKVTLKFTLLPNGFIDHLQLVKSSGTDSLDQAAIDSIRNALPFPNIHHYLNQAQEFSIDIVFEFA